MNKLKNNRGMSIGELLVATIIMLLVSVGLVTGVTLSSKQFVQSLRQSEAEELYSTLSTLITNELRYTNSLTLKNNNEVDTLFSVTYALKSKKTSLVTLDENGDELSYGYGQLAFGNDGEYNRLVGSASYTSYNLGANAKIAYDKDKNLFTVNLDIGIIDGDSIVSHSFDVRSINNITIEDNE